MTFTDQFCGAGGSSQGVRNAAKTIKGLEVKLALNHWQLAIDTHQHNFPDTVHILGNSRDKVKQCGNAVTPPVMQWLVERVVKSLDL